MSFEITSPNTGDTLSTENLDGVRKIWEKGCQVAEQNEDFFAEMEGMSPTSLIQTKTDTSKGMGQEIVFTNRSGFYGEGKQGDALFENESDFEKILTDSYSLEVDYLRNSTRYTERAEEKMGMRGEIVDGVPTELGKWLGRTKTHRLMMMFRHKLNAQNIIYANRKSLNTLTSADTLAWDPIVAMGTQLKPMGGLPAMVGKAGKNTVYKNVVIATVPALYSLKLDSDYRTLQRDAGTRGKLNCIFSGGYDDVDGHIIREYNPIDHDGRGPVGSPMNPKAFLGAAIPSNATALVVKGGGSADAAADTTKMYFRDFPNYAYQFLPSDVLSLDGVTRYFLVVNPQDGTAEAGKIGMYAYVGGNNGNQITITAALGTGTARTGTVGDVTYNAGVWAGKHTELHPIGATIIPCNSKGVPIGWTFMLGQRAAYRGYGKHRHRRTTQDHEGGFVRDVFITSVFGQKLRQDRERRHNGVITMVHAVQYAEFDLPVVV